MIRNYLFIFLVSSVIVFGGCGNASGNSKTGTKEIDSQQEAPMPIENNREISYDNDGNTEGLPIPKGYRLPTNIDMEDKDGQSDWFLCRDMFPTPYFAEGDFDGDGTIDKAYILIKENSNDWGLFCFFKLENGYRVKEISTKDSKEWGSATGFLVYKWDKKKKICYDEKGELKKPKLISYDAIGFVRLETCGDIAFIYNRNSDKFEVYFGCDAEYDIHEITDIVNWKHPTKDVFAKNNINVLKVVLYNEKTHPEFHVNLQYDIDKTTVSYYHKLFTELASANAFWSYGIYDYKFNKLINVECDKTKKNISNVTINGNPELFVEQLRTSKDPDTDNILSRLIDLLEKEVPEIEKHRKDIDAYNAKHGTKVTLSYMLYNVPQEDSQDKYERNYYIVNVGDNMEDRLASWQFFYINKEMTEILVDDIVSGELISLDKWREQE